MAAGIAVLSIPNRCFGLSRFLAPMVRNNHPYLRSQRRTAVVGWDSAGDNRNGFHETAELMPEQRVYKLLAELTDAMALLLKYCDVPEQHVHDEISRSYREIDAPEAEQSTSDQLRLAERNLLGRMLTYWRTMPVYVDDAGSPLPLPLEGAQLSMHTLFNEAAKGDRSDLSGIDVEKAVRLMLGRTIALNDAGDYYPISYSFKVNTDARAGAVLNLAYLAEFAGTASHNAYKGQGGRFNAVARVQGFPVEQLPIVQAALNEQGYQFLIEMDAFIESKKAVGDFDGELRDIGVGMYLIDAPHEDSAD